MIESEQLKEIFKSAIVELLRENRFGSICTILDSQIVLEIE
jgi:hypothetical protein